jgi:glycosyltransferase involved in cell wall biosynthesis
MRIVFVTTFPSSRCAIGIYSKKLTAALRESSPNLHITVAAENGADAFQSDGYECIPCFDRKTDYVEDIFGVVCRSRAQIAHFQYVPDIFGVDSRFIRLLSKLQDSGIRTVITMHTVNRPLIIRRLVLKSSWSAFHRHLADRADRIIVHHSRTMKGSLVRQGVNREKIRVIPHGTTFMSLPESKESRRQLGLHEDKLIFLFFGYIHFQKNVHTVLEAFIRSAKEFSGSQLFITGMPWGNRWYNRLYTELLQKRIKMSRLKDRIIFRPKYVAQELVPAIFSVADVVLLPHYQKYGSASGAFHMAIGAQKPILFSQGPKFEDAEKIFATMPEVCIPPARINRWVEMLNQFAQNPNLRAKCQEATRDYAQMTSWAQIAKRHIELYEEFSPNEANAP